MICIHSKEKLPFLDALTIKIEKLQASHIALQKLDHTDVQLHKDSNHHPSQKRSMIKMVHNHARCICKFKKLSRELRYLNQALYANGCIHGETIPNRNCISPLHRGHLPNRNFFKESTTLKSWLQMQIYYFSSLFYPPFCK